jgi:hypothetical protein
MRYIRLVLLALFLTVYVVGCVHFNAKVRDACTHPSCTHGWYSKYNNSEKAHTIAWMLGAPVAAGGIYWLGFVRLPQQTRLRRAHRHLRIVK